jgi:imidazolonepropionase-like amidohydrolase
MKHRMCAIMPSPSCPDLSRTAATLTLLAAVSLSGCAPAEGDSSSGTDPAADGAAAGATQSGNTIAFVNVNVVPMDSEQVLDEQTVLVEGGRIVRIGSVDAVPVPDDAMVIEGGGRYLLPGLGEMHAHVPPDGDEAEEVLFLYLSQGVTAARGMLGQPGHLDLRERLASGELIGPRLYTSGPSLNGNSIPDPDSARRAVLHQKEAGYDFLKIHPGLTRDEYDAVAATAAEVGIPWAGHVPADVGLARALEVQQASVDHLDQYTESIVEEGTDVSSSLFFGVNLAGYVDETKIDEVARQTAEAGVWNVPTQSLIENVLLPEDPDEMANRPEMRYMSPETVARWVESKKSTMEAEGYSPELARRFVEVRRQLILALQNAGAKLLLGSDAPQIFQVPGFSIQHELRLMVESGLTPYQALRAGTYNVAVYFEAVDEFGTVEEGKSADLILVDGNPLDDVENVGRQAGVMARGQWFSAQQIEDRLTEIAASHGN